MPLTHRYLFIGGLHRSGTSLLTRLVAQLPGVSAIREAPVPENEGVYLQGAIPHDALSGRPMHFATDPEQHLTEAHALNRLETRLRMEADWNPWFPPGSWRVEKSPTNMTRMRLLQQLFPLSQFLVILRHPQIVAAAVEKWVDTPAAHLVDHWLDAHEQLLTDIPRIHSIILLRYEDVVWDPVAALNGIAEFLALPGRHEPDTRSIYDGNLSYPNPGRLTNAQIGRAARWGYLPNGQTEEAWCPVVQHPLRTVRYNVETCLGKRKN